MHRKNQLIVNLNNIKKNVVNLATSSHAKKVCMMVKANAYGHGLVPVVKALEEDVGSFGIISLEEANEIRKTGVQKDLWLFSNLWKDSISELERLKVTPVIGDMLSLENFLSSGSQIKFHLKFNTGMNRFGFRLEEIPALSKMIAGREKQIDGFATHMLDGNQFKDQDGFCSKQLEMFKEFVDKMQLSHELKYHLYKSAPVLLNENRIVDDKYMEWIRPGIACYGVYPDFDFPKEQRLLPAMSLTTRLVGFQEVKKGESVSYSASWTASQDSLIGVCQLGYADGLLRGLSNNLNMIVGNEFVPQVGNICMDYCMLDLTKVRSRLKIGDEVVVFGAQGDKIQAIEEVASLGKTIAYELMTSISPRVKRHYILDESKSL